MITVYLLNEEVASRRLDGDTLVAVGHFHIVYPYLLQ